MNNLPCEKTKAFKQAMLDAGIRPPTIIQTGGTKLNRFHVKGDKSGSTNGWYRFDPSFPAYGVFGSWKLGIKGKWHDPSTTHMSPSQQAAFKEKVDTFHKQFELEEQIKHEECQGWSKKTWEVAQLATDGHQYLQAKQVKSHGLKTYKDSLIMPVMDSSLVIRGMQFIRPDGSKTFKSGTKKYGNFFLIGDGKSEVLAICEGYATGATIHEATGYDVAIAFDAGNLKPAANALRSKDPSKKIVIAADNDQWGDKNKGLEQAKEAADAVNAALVYPSSPLPAGEQPTDFNDYANLFSLDFVKTAFSEAIAKAAPGSWIKVVSAHDLLAKKFPPRVNLLEPWFPQQGLAMIYAYRGVGKTQVSLESAYALASGGTFLGWSVPEQVNVLFIDGEMPITVLQERVAQIAASSTHKLKASLNFITPDMQDPSKGMLDLSRPADQAFLEPHLEGVKVIILDNLSTLCRSGKENESESWLSNTNVIEHPWNQRN